jgi:outer membrane protein insertion porin family
VTNKTFVFASLSCVFLLGNSGSYAQFSSAGALRATVNRPSSLVFAQSVPSVRLDEIVIVGVPESSYITITAALSASVGDALSTINVEEAKKQVEAVGIFRNVTVELRVVGTKNQLVITAALSPKLSAVEFRGSQLIPYASLAKFLDDQLNIAPGVLLNSERLNEAVTRLGREYRSRLPFIPNITFIVEPVAASAENPEASEKVIFNIDDAAPVRSIEVSGATLVAAADIKAAFQKLVDGGTFDATLYGQGYQATNALFANRGYSTSGISLEDTELVNGILNVGIVETRIASIDSSALGDNIVLNIKAGDFYNENTLLAEIKRLTNGQERQPAIEFAAASRNSVSIRLVLSDEATAPIKEIRIKGNSEDLVSQTELLNVLRGSEATSKIGENFNRLVANERDIAAIAAKYSEAGYLIGPDPKISFDKGIYTIEIQEQKAVRYEIKWRAPHNTQDHVILRELPELNKPFSLKQYQLNIGRLVQDGIISNPRPTQVYQNPANTSEFDLIIEVEEGQSGRFYPQFGYDSRVGFDGTIGVEFKNLFGEAHAINAELTAKQNDAGQNWAGSFAYTIPWLYLDFLDFKQTQTTLGFRIFSNITPGNQLANTAPPKDYKVPDPNDPSKNITFSTRVYTTRSSGLGANISREIFKNFSIGLAYSLVYEQQFLERNADLKYYLEDDVEAAKQMPVANLTSFVQLSGTYNTRNDPFFPTAGLYASGATGYGFGQEGERPLSWFSVSGGGRTYLGLGFNNAGEFGFGARRNMAIAVRVDAGAINGSAPSNRQFTIGGASNNEAGTLRGYDFGDFRGDFFYTASAEYRLDFGLETAVLNGLLGLAFVDCGDAFGGNASRSSRTTSDMTTTIPAGPQCSAGIGAQINLGLGPLKIPGIRFDYGWSAWNPNGKFHFRLALPF